MTLPLANIIQDVFQPVIDIFEHVLVFFHDSLGLPWGWAIIALTITVRTILIPLTYKQLKSTLALQQHAPELKKLQARYKDDPEKRNQEMMKFYKENKVNPFGSCLPLVFQMPVFISLFYMLRTDLKQDICPDIQGYTKAHHLDLASYSCTQYSHTVPTPKGVPFDDGFLFIPDITAKATGAVLIVLIVLYIGSQLASSAIMSVSADRNQRLLMMGLPFVFTIFIINFPAGLLLYWITTNFWTVGQSLVMREMRKRHAEANPPPEPELAVAGAGALAVVEEEKPKQGLLARAREAAGATQASSSSSSSEGKPAPKSGKPGAPPPRPPRQKKKRSGRRR